MHIQCTKIQLLLPRIMAGAWSDDEDDHDDNFMRRATANNVLTIAQDAAGWHQRVRERHFVSYHQVKSKQQAATRIEGRQRTNAAASSVARSRQTPAAGAAMMDS